MNIWQTELLQQRLQDVYKRQEQILDFQSSHCETEKNVI